MSPAPAAPPADWTRTLDIAAAVGSHFADQTIRQKPPRTRLVVDDPVADKARSVIVRKQHELAMPVDEDTAHWLANAEDAESGELVVLDYTLEWAPPPPGTKLPGHSYKVSGLEIQAVAGKERYTWVQDGGTWVRRDVATP